MADSPATSPSPAEELPTPQLTNEGGAAGATGAAGAPASAGGQGGAADPGALPEPDEVSEPDGVPEPGPLQGSPSRPQLNGAAAPAYDVLSYLARAGNLVTGLARDDWNPTAGAGDVSTFAADFTVGGAGSFASVQAAVTAAVAAGGSARRFIELTPGTYREVVCVPAGAPPLTLYSRDPDPSRTVIVFHNYSGEPKAVGTPANPCNPSLNSTSYGTSGSATFAAFAAEFHAKNLSFVNDTDEQAATGAVQAVALMTQGDRQIYENVRVLGNQDSLSLRTPSVDVVLRAYFSDCFIEGDTDFIFGRATVVFEGCTLRSVTSRAAGGVVLAPSTDSRNPYGFLVIRSRFTADATARAASTHLGRAWDESQVDVATYTANVATGIYPNGQALVRESTLGAHIQAEGPWRAAATTNRAYSSVAGAVPANRFYELGNSGPGSAAQ